MDDDEEEEQHVYIRRHESNDTASDDEDSEEDVWHVVSSKRSARGKTHLEHIQNAKTTFRFGEEDDQDDDDENPASFESLVNETTPKARARKKTSTNRLSSKARDERFQA